MKTRNIFIALAAVVVVALSVMIPTLGTVTYDETKTMTRNQVDALIALANATGAEISLNDVLWVDGDRADSYTPNGSMSAPYKTIATANAAAVSGDVIIVAPGAYAEVVAVTSGAQLFGWNVTGATLTGQYVLFNGSSLQIDGAAFIYNEDSADVDFRIESNGNANAVFVDAGNDRVGIFTAAPTVPLEVTGNTKVTGTFEATTSVSTADVTATDDLVVGGWPSFAPAIVAAQSYTISSASKAGAYIVEYSDTAVYDITLPETPADGTIITIIDGDLNAGSNNGTIYPQGTDTIQETTSFVQNANGEATQLLYSLTNTDWTIIGGYAE